MTGSRSTARILLSENSQMGRHHSNTTPIRLQYDSNTTPILLQYYSNTIPIRLHYDSTTTPILLHYDSTTTPLPLHCYSTLTPRLSPIPRLLLFFVSSLVRNLFFRRKKWGGMSVHIQKMLLLYFDCAYRRTWKFLIQIYL